MEHKILAEIKDSDLGLPTATVTLWQERVATRAILVKGTSVALLHVSNQGYYTLPGGGVKKEETLSDALTREVLEEVGAPSL